MLCLGANVWVAEVPGRLNLYGITGDRETQRLS